jgi:hypothetical protein
MGEIGFDKYHFCSWYAITFPELKVTYMKKLFYLSAILLLVVVLFSNAVRAQTSSLQYFRHNDQRGLNVFETTKADTVLFERPRVAIGGNLALDFQSLRHENNAAFVDSDGIDGNQLIGLSSGFNLPMANMTIDAQLDDGIRLNLVLYLATRHHEDTWVKAGYLQFDKLLFLKSPVIERLMERITLKVGVLEVDFGDQHFRRTDGGNAIYNPFIENYIMDEFSTEIGGEIYYHAVNGLFAMGGITTGFLNPTVLTPVAIDSSTGELNKYAPAFHAKLGYDKQVNDELRLRLTGSVYTVKGSLKNPLYFGDRSGSHYFFVIENTVATSDENAWSGRFNPLFSQQVTAFMINPFVKFHGLEFFGTYEIANGRIVTEEDTRKATQFAADVVYRFTRSEKFWVGVRYNTVTAEYPGYTDDITINRIAASAGWFLTKNIMTKLEYVSQVYNDFPATDIRSEAKFNGWMLEAVVAF